MRWRPPPETEEDANARPCLRIRGAFSVRTGRRLQVNDYRIAGIDVHKKMLAVVVCGVNADGNLQLERRPYANHEADIHRMREWFQSLQVREVVMESTAQYWRTVWRELESEFQLHLAQAMSNRAPRGRKRDYADAERLIRRLIAGELVLSYVPDREQRLWRTLAREKHLARRARVQQINALEAFLEQVHIKLGSVLSELTGVSGWRILEALAKGERDPATLAALADAGVKCTPEPIRGALAAAAGLRVEERAVLRQFLDRIELFGKQIHENDRLLAACLHQYQEAVSRLAEIPGLGADSAQQMIAEIGPKAEVFDSAAQLASWVGVCPGREESAGESKSDRSPKGNRPMRRLLAECAHAAVKAKGSIFEMFYRRKVAHLGHNKTVWAVAHKLCRIIWKVLHDGVGYEERGTRLNSKQEAKQLQRLKRTMRLLGYDPNSLRKLQPSANPAPGASLA
jgi:transposase